MRLRACAMTLGLAVPVAGAKMPPSIQESAGEPVKYVGTEQVDKRFHHGGLRSAVGVHHYQVHRANRRHPPEGGEVGWTYSHAPMLAFWRGRFYVQYLSNLKEEHNPPGRTLLASSEDGRRWTAPQVVFPVYALPEIRRSEWTVPEGTAAVMHQRMGFYVAPNGRLLTLGFYGYCPTPRMGPNDGQGLGRVVREVHADGTYGPIYFIRYNRHAGWNEGNTRHPFYKTSPDAGFVAACDALLADKLMTLQWWEEDRAKDGFYTLDPAVSTRALSFFHRPDGVVVALWKAQYSALSADEGKTWTPVVRSPTLRMSGAKVWGQRTEDGRYALVYNHSATRRNRFPMTVVTGDDGHRFDDMLLLSGEVPPLRFQGIHKDEGLQYFRGIAEGNGDPPGSHMWVTYSMGKEDIWVSRTRVPIQSRVVDSVTETFDATRHVSDLELWNLHVPQWAPLTVVDDPEGKGRCLELRDEEPYDYVQAQRAFPESRQAEVSFRAMLRHAEHAFLEVEVQGPRSERPMRLRFDPEWLSLDQEKVDPPPVRIAPGRWLAIGLRLDADAQTYDLSVDGAWVRRGIPFAQRAETLERVVFRTGPWRGDVDAAIVDGEPETPGLFVEDRPGADEKTAPSVFLIDDVRAGKSLR
jgi:hypothetical protein